MTHESGFADNVGNLLTHVLLTMLESDTLTNLPSCFACLHFFYWSAARHNFVNGFILFSVGQ